MSMNWIRLGPPIVTIPANAGVHVAFASSNKRRKTGPPLNPFGPPVSAVETSSVWCPLMLDGPS